VPWTAQYAQKLHSVSFSANLHRLSVVDARSQVQRQYNGVGRGVLIPGSLTSGILVTWNADALTLSGDRDAPVLQWLLEEMISRDSPVLRQFVCLLEQEGSGGPGVVVLPFGAISQIVRRVRARDMRVGLPSLDELISEDDAARSADAEAARRRDLMTLDTAGLGVEQSVEPFTAYSKVFVCGSATLRPGPWLSPAAPRVVEISTASDGAGKLLPLELGMFTYLFLDGVGYYDNRRARGVPPLGLMEYLKMRMQGMFTPFTMTGSYVLFMYQLRQAHLLIRSTSENTLATELRRVSAARTARGDEDDGGQEAWHSVIKWKLSPSLPGTPSYFRRKLQEVRAMTAALGLGDFVVTLTQDDATETRWPEFDELETLESIYVNEAPGVATFRDMPVEAARLFHDRFWAWFKYFVLDKNGPQIYGNVVAYVVRFESQFRGSIHCHIILWVKKEDRQRVTNEIISFLPPLRYAAATHVVHSSARAHVPPRRLQARRAPRDDAPARHAADEEHAQVLRRPVPPGVVEPALRRLLARVLLPQGVSLRCQLRRHVRGPHRPPLGDVQAGRGVHVDFHHDRGDCGDLGRPHQRAAADDGRVHRLHAQVRNEGGSDGCVRKHSSGLARIKFHASTPRHAHAGLRRGESARHHEPHGAPKVSHLRRDAAEACVHQRRRLEPARV
jgi:hypothetical protein